MAEGQVPNRGSLLCEVEGGEEGVASLLLAGAPLGEHLVVEVEGIQAFEYRVFGEQAFVEAFSD